MLKVLATSWDAMQLKERGSNSVSMTWRAISGRPYMKALGPFVPESVQATIKAGCCILIPVLLAPECSARDASLNPC